MLDHALREMMEEVVANHTAEIIKFLDTRPEKGLLNTREAANYLGLGESTLHRLRSRGEGPRCTWIGESVRYTREALNEFIAEHTEAFEEE